MPLAGRLFADDEELGKKDDDHIPGQTADLNLEDTLQWARRSMLAPKRRRRLAVAGIALVVLYLLVRQTRIASAPHGGYAVESSNTDAESILQGMMAPGGPPPRPETLSENELHYYDGPSMYYFLSKSLQRAARSQGFRSRNKNVVFAAANVQSLDRLIPMACEMARWNRNQVHVAVMGRHDLSIQDIREINSVDKACEIMWHDARPDYAAYSTDERHAESVFMTLEHMHTWLHPQVYVVESEGHEDVSFTKSMNRHAQKHGSTVVRLPENAMQTMQWVTRLDTGSLTAWHNTYTEILVRAPTGASGSLIRLLHSIERADYFGVRPPHLTIELPPELDPHTENFLERFIWPPQNPSGGVHTSQLTLRRRIPIDYLDPIEASLRYIESFWPSRTKDSHVLLLSPDVQLSPLYYHFLLYNLLEYKHSSFAVGTRDIELLMGISLMSPTTLLDEQTPFAPPLPRRRSSKPGDRVIGDYDDTTFFQWQAPDTHACLYFGDKWKELHSFFSLRVGFGPQQHEKVVSAALPAYAEYFLELMRARGWFVLYPGRLDDDLATAHNELYQAPDEFKLLRAEGEEPTTKAPTEDSAMTEHEPHLSEDGDFLYSTRAPLPRPHVEEELAWTPLHVLLPSGGDLPELASVPLLSHTGKDMTLATADREAADYAYWFQNEIGGCREGARPPPRYGFGADDLFCDTPAAGNGARAGSKGGAKPAGDYEFAWKPTKVIIDVPIDEDGIPLEQPVPEAKKQAMSAEFEQHLLRQAQGRGRKMEKGADGGKGSDEKKGTEQQKTADVEKDGGAKPLGNDEKAGQKESSEKGTDPQKKEEEEEMTGPAEKEPLQKAEKAPGW